MTPEDATPEPDHLSTFEPPLRDALEFTQILMIAHRNPHDGTKTCLEQCIRLGASAFLARGYADISFGRCSEITRSMDEMLKKGWAPEKGVLLNIDDDMYFEPKDVQTISDYVRSTGRPASGIYGMSNGRVIANNQDGCEWEVGGGFLAIRLDHLMRLEQKLGRVRGMYEKGVIPLACSGIHPTAPDRYTGDDFWLCRELGGVDLLRLAIGHYKQIPIFPDEVTLDRLMNRERLPGKVPLYQPQGRRLALHAASQEYEQCRAFGTCVRAKGHSGTHSDNLPEQEFDSGHPEGWALS